MQRPNTTMARDTPSHCRVTPIHPSQGTGAPSGSPSQKLSSTRAVVGVSTCQGR